MEDEREIRLGHPEGPKASSVIGYRCALSTFYMAKNINGRRVAPVEVDDYGQPFVKAVYEKGFVMYYLSKYLDPIFSSNREETLFTVDGEAEERYKTRLNSVGPLKEDWPSRHLYGSLVDEIC